MAVKRRVSADAEGGVAAVAELARIADEIAAEFPPRLERSVLLLLDRDPRHLHVQWNLTSELLERGRASFGQPARPPELVLRLWKLVPAEGRDEGAPPRRGVGSRRLAGPSGELEVGLSEPGGIYEAEVGLGGAEGGWVSLQRSNRVRLPEGRAAPPVPRGAPQAPFPEVVRPRRAPATPLPTAVQAPPAPPPAAARVARAAGESGHGLLPDPALVAELPSGEAGEFPEPGPAPGAPGPVMERSWPSWPEGEYTASGAAWSGAGFWSGAWIPRGGPLELEIELLVRGRGAPGQEIRILGQSVRAGADGGFFLRVALPAGPTAADLLWLPGAARPLDEDE